MGRTQFLGDSASGRDVASYTCVCVRPDRSEPPAWGFKSTNCPRPPPRKTRSPSPAHHVMTILGPGLSLIISPNAALVTTTGSSAANAPESGEIAVFTGHFTNVDLLVRKRLRVVVHRSAAGSCTQATSPKVGNSEIHSRSPVAPSSMPSKRRPTSARWCSSSRTVINSDGRPPVAHRPFRHGCEGNYHFGRCKSHGRQ